MAKLRDTVRYIKPLENGNLMARLDSGLNIFIGKDELIFRKFADLVSNSGATITITLTFNGVSNKWPALTGVQIEDIRVEEDAILPDGNTDNPIVFKKVGVIV